MSAPLESSRPVLLTMGDACGIGPEIAVAAWAQDRGADLRLVGDVGVFRRALDVRGLRLPVAVLEHVDDPAPPDALPVWQPPGLPQDLLAQPVGRVSAQAGAAAARCIWGSSVPRRRRRCRSRCTSG